jgi:hypothetical protein
MDTEPVVGAYGMGLDSTAMLIGWQARSLQRPDAILFADTGDEKAETYAYLPIINQWLHSVGYPAVTVLRNASPKAGDASLYAECVRKSVLPSLAYGGHSCSLKWKVGPQWAYCRERYGWTQPRKARGASERPAGTWRHGPLITKLIGYDSSPADLRRVANAVGKWPPGHRYRYPLVEWGWTRAMCEDVIRAAGLPVPMKSACFMCPASKKSEIVWLAKTHPLHFEKVVHMEERAKARGLRTVQGNGRNFAWADCGSALERQQELSLCEEEA